MNESIKNTIFSKSSLPIIFFFGAVLLLAFSLFVKFVPTSFYRFILVPAMAGEFTVAVGINEFSGLPPKIIDFVSRVELLISLALMFVAGPISFIYLRRKIFENKNNQKRSTTSLKICYYISYGWFVLLPIAMITASFASNSVLSTMKKNNADSKYRDTVISELTNIAYAAQQYYILPSEEGGGSKSFLKNNSRIDLSDLGYKETNPLGRCILYQQKSDTTLFLHFIGNRQGSLSSSYSPYNNNFHVVEYDVVINPLTININALN